MSGQIAGSELPPEHDADSAAVAHRCGARSTEPTFAIGPDWEAGLTVVVPQEPFPRFRITCHSQDKQRRWQVPRTSPFRQLDRGLTWQALIGGLFSG